VVPKIKKESTVASLVLEAKRAERAALDRQRLGQRVDLITDANVGESDGRSRGILSLVDEHHLSQFAGAEGKKGGKRYSPRCAVEPVVEILEPYGCPVHGLRRGSSGMFVQTKAFIQARGRNAAWILEGRSL
jgi:type I restriction enzyme M protein